MKNFKNFLNSINDKKSINQLEESTDQETILAKKYVDDMIDKYKNYKDIRNNILSNLVNSEYGRNSNSFVTKVWSEFNKRFPS